MDESGTERPEEEDPAGQGGWRAPGGFRPSPDPVYHYLLRRALEGELAVHRAVVPVALIRPYDERYRLRDLPIGGRAIRLVLQAWADGSLPVVRVYPDGGRFVLSDDYVYYEAAREVERADLPCLVLGEAQAPGVMDIRGPLSLNEVRRTLGQI